MTWHVAGSLEQLRAQINLLFPNRSKASDGSIGDAAHATRDSDHNPWYEDTVTARDFTHDPDGGMPGQWLADSLSRNGDRRLKYVIWNRRIWAPARGWRPYTGENPHTHHVHVSVVASPLCEGRAAWSLRPSGAAPAQIVSTGTTHPQGSALLPSLRGGSTGPSVAALQAFLKRYAPGYTGAVRVNGEYDPATMIAVREFQGRVRIARDGVVGPDTNGALWAAGYRGL